MGDEIEDQIHQCLQCGHGACMKSHEAERQLGLSIMSPLSNPLIGQH